MQFIHRREIFWDWRAALYDLSDARYLVRRRWLELDHAIAMMPQYADLFRATTSGWAGFDPLLEQNTQLYQSFVLERDTRIEAVDWRDIQRERLCLYEIWYRKWVRGFVITLPSGKTVECDFDKVEHCQAVLEGAPVKMATFQKVRLAWYCGPHFLYDIPSPYDHGNFPYIPFFGYREDLTQVPYGLIRSMISPQDEINARKSKALWLLNSRRVTADSDAVEDHEVAREEVARPDAYIILDSKRRPQSRFEVASDGQLSAQQFQAMQESKQEIEEASGVHKVMQGQQSGASSGLAINSLVEQGLNTLAEINDNYRHARRLVGEQLFLLLQCDMRGKPTRVRVGDGMQEKIIVLNQPVVDPRTGATTIQNDISGISPKVTLDDIPSTPTFRLQQLQMLTEITKSLPPNIQGMVIDFIVAATDLPTAARSSIAYAARSAFSRRSNSNRSSRRKNRCMPPSKRSASRCRFSRPPKRPPTSGRSMRKPRSTKQPPTCNTHKASQYPLACNCFPRRHQPAGRRAVCPCLTRWHRSHQPERSRDDHRIQPFPRQEVRARRAVSQSGPGRAR